MQRFKKISALGCLELGRPCGAAAIALMAVMAGAAHAASCVAPLRPFVPNDPEVAQDYADIIRRDFELYIRDIQSYFRCLEEERARAFEEAREVSEKYGRFLELFGR